MATVKNPSVDPGPDWVPPSFARRAAAERWWRDSDDVTLARGIEANDANALAELRARYAALIDRLARQHCSRLGHRNNRCSGLGDGGCDQAYTSAHRVLRAQLPKKFLAMTLHNGASVGRALGSHAHGTHTDILRAWNHDRGIVERPRPKGPTLVALTEAIDRCRATGPEWQAAAAAGVEIPAGAQRWIDALHADACQPASQLIDHERVLRRLLHQRGANPFSMIPQPLPGWARELVNRIDECVAAVTPDNYDNWLDRPRQQTRSGPGNPNDLTHTQTWQQES